VVGPEASAAAGRKARRRAYTAIAVLLFCVVLVFWWRPASLDLWIKAAHVVAVISWMAGLLYLPRLFIYHTDAEIGSVQSETFKVMEERLLKVIMRPAMMISWVLGLWLAYSSFAFSGGWLWAKIAAVVALTAIHVRFLKAWKSFAADRREHTARYWRIMNEGPTLLMIAIVILVIVKPF
jgi:protoporphyrinogen IX oxidase